MFKVFVFILVKFWIEYKYVVSYIILVKIKLVIKIWNFY